MVEIALLTSSIFLAWGGFKLLKELKNPARECHNGKIFKKKINFPNKPVDRI